MKNEKTFSLMVIIFVISLFLSYHVYYYCINNFNNKKVDNYFVSQDVMDNYKKIVVEKEDSNDYLGILSIPKIHFQKGFYNIDDERNNVNQNIEVLKTSEMPNVLGSSLIIAGHKGNSYLGYFNDLDKLEINDEIDIYYNNYKYQYEVFDIYELDKNGKITFSKNIHENYLVLTTCSKKKDKQLIVLSKMILT